MRQTFISLLDKLVVIIVALILVGALLGGIAAMFTQDGGFLVGIGIWIAGAIYAIVFGGSIFLALGIYDNTKRTAEAVEKLSGRPSA